MKTYKISPNFWLHEYIPRALYEATHKRPHRLMNCIDPRMIKIDQVMRNRYGPATINNWYTGGEREWSGVRTAGSPYYSFFSEHSWGRASDKLFSDMSAEEVRADIKEHYEDIYKPLGLTCIEDGVGWVHSDARALIIPGNLLLVNP